MPTPPIDSTAASSTAFIRQRWIVIGLFTFAVRIAIVLGTWPRVQGIG
jgi:hypothetical protein